MSVAGGNWRIFDKMVHVSGAVFLPNTSVASIAAESKDSVKYILKTRSSTDSTASEETLSLTFDDVVIATPYQFSKIAIADGILGSPIDEIPYIKLHVTIFASPFQLSPTYFKVAASKVPTTVLTTLAEGDTPESGVQGVGKAGFYSISTLRLVLNPKTGKAEYLYKIFSPEKVTPKLLR